MGLGTGQYAHYWPRKAAIRVFMMGIFFFGLHINTAYRSFLIKMLQNPRYNKQISSVTEAIEAGLVFHVAEGTLMYFEKNDSVRSFRKLFMRSQSHHYKISVFPLTTDLQAFDAQS